MNMVFPRVFPEGPRLHGHISRSAKSRAILKQIWSLEAGSTPFLDFGLTFWLWLGSEEPKATYCIHAPAA